jgi:hypothetical protein
VGPIDQSSVIEFTGDTFDSTQHSLNDILSIYSYCTIYASRKQYNHFVSMSGGIEIVSVVYCRNSSLFKRVG